MTAPTEPLQSVYDPAAIEPEINSLWLDQSLFVAAPDDRPPEQRYTIVIPPPNVTGALHLGHALNNTLQDILIRLYRMKGRNTLWLPGSDHAGIATQAVVEKRLRTEEGKTRHEIGRDALVQRIWDWKDEYEKRIITQLQSMGCSCDWTRTRFTLDEGLARAVRHTFFRFFQDGLIFRGKRLVNWDTQLQTAVADDEVYHETVKGHFWHFNYPVNDPKAGEPDRVTIATTRPETMLGDTAVAVHPNPEGAIDRQETELRQRLKAAPSKEKAGIQAQIDALEQRRETHLPLLRTLRDMANDGRSLTLPLVEREIPLIADEWADPLLGSGCVKITPAHDPNDYEVGIRNSLPMVNVLNPDGTINENGGPYQGQTIPESRKNVVADLEARGLMGEIEDKDIDLGHSDRSKTPIEPYLSDQWFVEMGKLAPVAMRAVEDGRVKFFPARYAKSYLDWLGEKRDWCISRQLWWGHRIPIWYCDTCTSEEIEAEFGGRDDVALRFDEAKNQWLICSHDEDLPTDAIAGHTITRDEDVLDTWFSSALWPFSTMGWPDQTDDLRYYYPSNVLVTSRDIISNWVCRMVLTGLYNMNEVPFHHVYIHTKILDARGDTMSKSKGNGVDPLDVVHVYGADALRYTMADMATETQDVRMPVDYICPQCGHLTPQAAVVPRGKLPADVHTVKSAGCKKPFATQWARSDLKDELGVARETSEKFEIGRNFCNKLWNAARFAFMNLEGTKCQQLDPATLPVEDRWILSKLSLTAREVNAALTGYQFARAVTVLRDFFWDCFCDWYLELVKARISDNRQPDEARQVLATCLDQVLRLWHPILPFITERLWRQLNEVAPQRGLPGRLECPPSDNCVRAACPPDDGWPALVDPELTETFEHLQELTRAVRDVRMKQNISPRDPVNVLVKTAPQDIEPMKQAAYIVHTLARIGELGIDPAATRPANSASVVVGSMQVFVLDCVDDAQERQRLHKELDEVDKFIAGKETKLGNANFAERAPAEVVQAERDRLAELQHRRERIQNTLSLIEG